MSFQTNQRLSLVIPRVFPQWIDEQKIIRVFHDQHIGRIFKVSIKRMPNEKGRDYPIYKAFLYFSVWYDNEIAYNLQQRIFGPAKQARVVYDDPWYWVLFEHQSARLNQTDQRLMRLDREVYWNEQIMFEHLANQQVILSEHQQMLNDQQQTLREQQHNMEHLQRFCMQRGLNVPFWNPQNPPADADLDLALAETAVRVAEAVLDYDDDDDMNLDTQYTAQSVAEAALYDDGDDDMNLETSQLAQQMTAMVLDEEEPATQHEQCICEACIGGEEFYIQEARRNIVLNNPAIPRRG
jgi:hypothetical protein